MHLVKDLIDVYDWIIPMAILAVSIIGGLIAEKIVTHQLKRLEEKPGALWQLENSILATIHGLPFIWCLLVGMHFALYRVHIEPGMLGEIQKALLILFMFSLIVIIARVVGNMVSRLSSRLGNVLHSTSILENITRLTVYILGFLAILQTMGISILPVLTALGVGGLAVSLALNDTLSNFFAGLHILISRQIRLGDYIRLDSGQEGTVMDISLRNTTIRQLNNNLMILPNLKLSTAIVTNFDKTDSKMLLPIPITIKRDEGVDLDKIEASTLAVANTVLKQMKEGVASFKPYLRYTTYGDTTLEFTVYLETKNYPSQFALKHEFIKQLKQKFEAENITQLAIPASVINPDTITTHPVV